MKQERLEMNSYMKETENKQKLHLKLERPRSFENVVAPNGDDDDGYGDDDNDGNDDDGAGSFDSGRRDTESANYKILKCPWSVQTQTAQDADYKILRCAPSVHTQTDTNTMNKVADIKQMVDSLSHNIPRITYFSGVDPVPKGWASFDLWKYEVNCVSKSKTYSEAVITQAIRRSLRAQAQRVLVPLGFTASSTEIIHKLECVFGDAASGNSLMQEFYSERQKATETVTEWGFRIRHQFLIKNVYKI